MFGQVASCADPQHPKQILRYGLLIMDRLAFSPARLAIFDIDGTLCQSVGVHRRSLLETLSGYHFPALNTEWGSYPHHTDTAIFWDAWKQGRGTAPGVAERAEFIAAHEAAFRGLAVENPIRETSGATALLTALEARGWRIVFATGSIRSLAFLKLHLAGIPFEPMSLVTASEFYSRTDLVTNALKTASSLYGDHEWKAVSIGDGIWDLNTARILDLAFVGVGDELHRIALRDYDVLPDFDNIEHALSVLEQATEK